MAPTQDAPETDEKVPPFKLPDEHPLATAMRDVSSNLRSLRGFVDLLEPVLRQRATEVIKANRRGYDIMKAGHKLANDQKEQSVVRVDDLGVEYIPIKGEKNAFILKASAEDVESVMRATKELGHITFQVDYLFEGSLMTLISIVEAFIGGIIRYHASRFPEALGDAGNFTLKELQNFETVADARASLVDRKVEETMRGSFEDWLAFLRDKLSLSMGYLEEYRSRLVEAFQRRNLLVHNRGVVNAIYLSKVDKESAKGISKGQKLKIDRKYLDNCIELFEKGCLLIAAEEWKRIDPEDDQRARCLGKIAYSNICEKNYAVAESVSRFVMLDKKMAESSQATATINYWLSKKKQGQYKDIEKELKAADFSAKDPIFKLAHAALKDDADTFFRILPFALAGDSLSKEQLDEFPIFEEMRKDQRYEAYRPQMVTVRMNPPAKGAETDAATAPAASEQTATGVPPASSGLAKTDCDVETPVVSDEATSGVPQTSS